MNAKTTKRNGLQNPETLRALTPGERQNAGDAIANLVDVARALRWIAQTMTASGADGPAPARICDLPHGAGPDWFALAVAAEVAIANATDGFDKDAVRFPLEMWRPIDGTTVVVGDQAMFDDYRGRGFVATI